MEHRPKHIDIKGKKPSDAELYRHGIDKHGKPTSRMLEMPTKSTGEFIGERGMEKIEKGVDNIFLPKELQNTLNTDIEPHPTSALTPAELKQKTSEDLPIPGAEEIIDSIDVETPDDDDIEEELNSLDGSGVGEYEEDQNIAA